jgi:hypothetical protein
MKPLLIINVYLLVDNTIGGDAYVF